LCEAKGESMRKSLYYAAGIAVVAAAVIDNVAVITS
jgi:hypothetical protein